MQINIIGAGKVGRTLGKLIVINHLGTIASVFNTTQEKAAESVQFIGEGDPVAQLTALQAADLTFITSTDDKIEEICKQLVSLKRIKPGSFVVHCSGALSSDILLSAKTIDCQIASAHFVKSFSNAASSVDTFVGTFCSIEGDEKAETFLSSFFPALGARPVFINKSSKVLYHVAAVFACNYLVTLFDTALKCLCESGVSEDIAIAMIYSYMEGVLDNIIKSSPQAALTGPLKRGDINIIRAHLQSFTSPAVRDLYTALGQATLNLTDHDAELRGIITRLLA